MIHFNLPGFAIFGIAFGAAFGVCHLIGTADEGPVMMIAGPLCCVLDGSYRYWKAERSWFAPHAGGSMFFIPIWLFGIVWLVLGIIYTVRGQA